jgi:CheY-like chemotaxis protein
LANLRDDMTVLVVDDQAGIRFLVAEFLKNQFELVLTAQSGRETLNILEREPVDLVLLDVNMPGIDGLTTLGLLRERGYNCPVVLMTGLEEDAGFVKKIEELRVTGVLTKPFDLYELKQLIARSLSSVKEE